ncbi:hypothetical protein [Bradyrhizobium sp. USDA 4486]
MLELDDHARLKALLSSSREWFWHWRSPAEVLKELDRINRTILSDYSLFSGAFVTHREAKQLREIWVLAKCAVPMDLPRIRLCPRDPPDGYIGRGNEQIPAEILELLEPGRKRNLEFGPHAPSISMDQVENWIRRAHAIPGALAHAIQKKKAKSYPQSTELFVYLNIGEYGIRQKQTEGAIRSLLAQPVDPFAAIHVRWKEKVFSDNGATFVDRNILADEKDDDASLWRMTIEDSDD